MSEREEFVWSEKYRPKKVEDLILPTMIKSTLLGYLQQGNIPNLLFVGRPGTGKTSAAKAMLEQLNCDYILIKGSLDAGIDVIRNKVTSFASSMSFKGGRKYIIFDEADGLSQGVQQSLRNFIDTFTGNAGFIFTANYKTKLIEPLQSRFSVIDFKIPKEDKTRLAGEFYKRLCYILDTENVEYDQKVLVQVISKYFPDWRKILNEVQGYSSNGKIDIGILINFTEVAMKTLVSYLKDKNFTEMRTWVGTNSDVDTHTILRKFYDTAKENVTKDSIPGLVLLINEFDYKSSFVVDQEINLVAFFTRVMMEVEFL